MVEEEVEYDGCCSLLVFILHASLPVSLANVMISDLISQPRGLTVQPCNRPAGALSRRLVAHHASVAMYTLRTTTHLI